MDLKMMMASVCLLATLSHVNFVADAACQDTAALVKVSSCLSTLSCRNTSNEMCTLGCYAQSVECFDKEGECVLSTSDCEATLLQEKSVCSGSTMSCSSQTGQCLQQHKQRCAEAVDLVHPSSNQSNDSSDSTHRTLAIAFGVLLGVVLILLIVAVVVLATKTDKTKKGATTDDQLSNGNTVTILSPTLNNRRHPTLKRRASTKYENSTTPALFSPRGEDSSDLLHGVLSTTLPPSATGPGGPTEEEDLSGTQAAAPSPIQRGQDAWGSQRGRNDLDASPAPQIITAMQPLSPSVSTNSNPVRNFSTSEEAIPVTAHDHWDRKDAPPLVKEKPSPEGRPPFPSPGPNLRGPSPIGSRETSLLIGFGFNDDSGGSLQSTVNSDPRSNTRISVTGSNRQHSHSESWRLLKDTVKATGAFSHDRETKAKKIQRQLMAGNFQQGKVLGKGTNGVVYLIILADGSFVAMKQMDTSGTDEEESNVLMAELRLMANLRHENVIRYFYATHDPKANFLNLFMEYVHGGSLGSLVRTMGKPLLEPVVKLYIRQIVAGLAFLHEHHVAHRDIKADNILIESEGAIKLADFGSAKRLQLDVKAKGIKKTWAKMPKRHFNHHNTGLVKATDTIVGTPLWMAPEVVNPDGDLGDSGENQDAAGYTTKADIWSLGITLVELLNEGQTPWPTFSSAVEAMIHIGNIKIFPLESIQGFDSLSEECVDFLRQCLHVDPDKRPSARELEKHKFLAVEEEEGDDDWRTNGNTVSEDYRDAIDDVDVSRRNANRSMQTGVGGSGSEASDPRGGHGDLLVGLGAENTVSFAVDSSDDDAA